MADWKLAEQLKQQGMKGVEIAKQLGITPGRVSQVLGKRRNLNVQEGQQTGSEVQEAGQATREEAEVK